MKIQWKDKLKFFWKKSFPYICIAIVSLFAMSIFLSKQYYSGHDFNYHAGSIAGMADGDFFDIFTGKVYGVMSNDLGYGEGLFYPPLTHMTGAVIYKVLHHFTGFGIYAAMRITYFLIIFLSGVFMYKFILLVTKHKKAALFSSFFYITFPYFLADVIVRCAMNECTMFVFMPIVLIGLYHLIHSDYKKFLIYFTIGCIGIVHSHLVLTLYFVIFCLIGFLPKIKLFLEKKKILYLLLSAVITALISLPFLLPMLEQKTSAVDYRVFEPGFMTNVQHVNTFRIPLAGLLSGNYVSAGVPVFLSYVGILLLIYAILCFKDVRNKDNTPFLISAIIFVILGFFLASSFFSWDKMPESLLLIQFPWRFFSFIALGVSIVIGIVIPKLEKNGNAIYLIIGLCCVFNIARINSFALANTPLAGPESELNHSSTIYIDYLPTSNPTSHLDQSFNNEHSHIPTSSVEGVDISVTSYHSPDMTFDVSNVTEETTITIPRIYYLGYKIELEYADGSKEVVPYLASEYGFIDFKINKDAKVTVTYPGTKLQQVSFWISGITIVACAGAGIYYIYRQHKKK